MRRDVDGGRARPARAAVLSAALILALSACSGSGAGNSRGGGGSGAGGAGAASKQVVADHARAESAVLRSADLPAGWSATEHVSSPDVPGVDESLARCLGVSVGLLDPNDPSKADSPDFSAANGSAIANSVGYEATVGRAQRLAAVLRSPKMAPCLNSAIKTYLAFRLTHPSSPSQSVPAGISLGQPTTTRLPFPTTGDSTVAYRFVVPVEGAGSPLDVYGDFVFAAKGRAGTVLSVESQGAPPDAALEQRLVATVVARITG